METLKDYGQTLMRLKTEVMRSAINLVFIEISASMHSGLMMMIIITFGLIFGDFTVADF